MQIVKVSSQRQITLSKKLLKRIGVERGGKLAITIRGNTLIAEPLTEDVVESTAGSLKRYIDSSKLGKNFKDVEEETKKIVAQVLAHE